MGHIVLPKCETLITLLAPNLQRLLFALQLFGAIRMFPALVWKKLGCFILGDLVAMDMKALQCKLGMESNGDVLGKAEELVRLCRVQFDAAAFGIGDVCKAVLCFELACSVLQVPFDRQKGIRLSGLSEKAYNRSLTTVQNALGIRTSLHVRELAVQFGCVRLVQVVQRVLATYKERFLASLPEARRRHANFERPVFTAVAFFLCARKNKLKVDRAKLMEVSSTSDPEFSNVATSMNDLCFDLVGVEKEKPDPKQVKRNRALLDNSNASADSSGSDPESDTAGRSKRARDYELWKESVLENRKEKETDVKKRRQTQLNFKTVLTS